jgi:adenylyltransferase/sulfurtransferase
MMNDTGEEAIGISHVSVRELKERMDRGEDILLLDVREPHEYDIVNLGGVLMSLGELPARVNELDLSREIVVICHHGGRSARAVSYLLELGFKRVANLSGGIDRWAVEIDTTLPRY